MPKERTINGEVQKGVVKKFYAINAILLLIHSIYFLLLWGLNADIIFYYNVFSILTYSVSFALIYKLKDNAYSLIVSLEALTFMILAIACMGWDFGFQLYCFGFFISSFFEDFYFKKQRHISRKTVIQLFIILFFYIFARVWTYYNPSIYVIENEFRKQVLYIFNIIIAFSFVAIYEYIYGITVYQLESALRDMAERDPLTGLYNRRKMISIMNEAQDRFNKSGSPVCAAILDVDFFKKVNDKYGHDAGDYVLKTLANILLAKRKKYLNTSVGRWGGEEFVILLEKYPSEEKAIQMLEETRKEIQQMSLSHCGQTFHISVTIGAAFMDENTNMNELIKKADRNLYYGKEHGRNALIFNGCETLSSATSIHR